MNLRSFMQSKMMCNLPYRFHHLIGAEISSRKLGWKRASHHLLSIWLQSKENLVAYIKLSLSSFFISILLHTILGFEELILQHP